MSKNYRPVSPSVMGKCMEIECGTALKIIEHKLWRGVIHQEVVKCFRDQLNNDKPHNKNSNRQQ